MVAVTLVLLAGMVWLGSAWYLLMSDRGPSQAAGVAGSETPGMPSNAETILTLHGSNAIGSELAPALAEAFLRAGGARDVRRVQGADAADASVVGTLPARTAPQRIEIAAHGSRSGFEGLVAGEADIAMASRRIGPTERHALRDLGDMRSPGSEHLLGLDGVAVIVSNSLQVDALNFDQLRAIFTCGITDWSDVGGPTEPIALYAPDDGSGTLAAFAESVLGGADLCVATRRYEDSAELAQRVSHDGAGIGFVGMPFIGNNKALRLSAGDSIALAPSALTVGTDDYLLSRPLYLYTATDPAKPEVAEFVAFARSGTGRDIVADAGFVDPVLSERTVDALPGAPGAVLPNEAPGDYTAFTRDALRLPVDIRFEAGTDRIDGEGLRDIERIARLVSGTRYEGSEILLVGFSDSRGDGDVNRDLSIGRATAVAQQMQARGITTVRVAGFGEALPVDRNDTDSGRAKNRRVEVWLR